MINQEGDTPNSYFYSGEQLDGNVGFYYLRARYYDSSRGRFTVLDQFSGSNFEPIGLHKYLYAQGNPVTRIDPSGQFSLIEAIAVVAIVGVLTNTILKGIQNWWIFRNRGVERKTDRFAISLTMITFSTPFDFVSSAVGAATVEELDPSYGSPLTDRQKGYYEILSGKISLSGSIGEIPELTSTDGALHFRSPKNLNLRSDFNGNVFIKS